MGGGGGVERGQKKERKKKKGWGYGGGLKGLISSQTPSSLPRKCFSIAATPPKGSISPLGEKIIITTCKFGRRTFHQDAQRVLFLQRCLKTAFWFSSFLFFLLFLGGGGPRFAPPCSGHPREHSCRCSAASGRQPEVQTFGFFVVLLFLLSHFYNWARRSTRRGGSTRRAKPDKHPSDNSP